MAIRNISVTFEYSLVRGDSEFEAYSSNLKAAVTAKSLQMGVSVLMGIAEDAFKHQLAVIKSIKDKAREHEGRQDVITKAASEQMQMELIQ